MRVERRIRNSLFLPEQAAGQMYRALQDPVRQSGCRRSLSTELASRPRCSTVTYGILQRGGPRCLSSSPRITCKGCHGYSGSLAGQFDEMTGDLPNPMGTLGAERDKKQILGAAVVRAPGLDEAVSRVPLLGNRRQLCADARKPARREGKA